MINSKTSESKGDYEARKVSGGNDISHKIPVTSFLRYSKRYSKLAIPAAASQTRVAGILPSSGCTDNTRTVAPPPPAHARVALTRRLSTDAPPWNMGNMTGISKKEHANSSAAMNVGLKYKATYKFSNSCGKYIKT